jgi:MinD-like ATPase involved in chromosome partitioning or flagellar assembly
VSEGSVVTFYSYKGGVGRSFLLANVAATLARWGLRVLCVDFDLEAPGLAHYFRPWTPDAGREAAGVVELIEAFVAGKQRPYGSFVSDVRFPGEFGLQLLAAGRHDGSYMKRVQSIDWSKLYSQRHLGSYLESLREQWIADYDFVLVDSRTGVSDTGGICTVQLPDLLVFLFCANRQSIDGVVEVVDKAIARRNDLPYDRPGLVAVPVLSRFDQRAEYELANTWLDVVCQRMDPFLGAWIHRDVTVAQFFEHVRVPYFSVWSFGERLPVVEEDRTVGPERVSFHIETIAALLANRGAGADRLVTHRDSYVDAVRSGVRRAAAPEYDAFISYSLADAAYARALAEQLGARGLTTFFDQQDAAGDAASARRVTAALNRSRCIVALLGRTTSRWQVENVRMFLRLGVDEARAAIPVLLPGSDPGSVPRFLRPFRDVDARDLDIPEVCDRLARLIAIESA